jgi:hypothetical protein
MGPHVVVAAGERTMKKMKIGIALIVLLTSTALAQNTSTRIGDDYARAALRAVISTTQTGITALRISILINEADVEASTPTEEASLKEINRILGIWITRPSYDRQPCYVALKANLKARNGATPEACK